MSVFRLLARAAALTALTSSAWAAPFSVNVDGTATDVATGLVWDRCYVGQNLSDARCPVTATRSQVTWAEAFMLAESLNLLAYKGHADWRIPSIKELLSLRDLGRVVSPAIDLSAFPDAPPTQFWSSTTLASLPSSAWTVQFSFGDTVFGPKTDALHLRLVRGGATTAAFDALDTTAPVTTDGPTVVSPGIGGAQASASVIAERATPGIRFPPGTVTCCAGVEHGAAMQVLKLSR